MWGRVTHPTSKCAVEPSAELVFHLQGEDREVGVNEIHLYCDLLESGNLSHNLCFNR
jgi:hypothetical protein